MLSEEDKRRHRVLANFATYQERKRNEFVENIKLPDDTNIRRMAADDPVGPNIRGRPITDPDERVHTKAPVLRSHPKFVQYSGRNNAATELTRRRGPKPVVLGESSRVTNKTYLKFLDKNSAFRERPRIDVYYGGERSTIATQNLPPSNLDTMMSGREIYNLGNSRKFNRAFKTKHYFHSGRGHRMQYGGRLRDGVGQVVKKKDVKTQRRGIRGYNNPFTRSEDLAPNTGWANSKKYARNVARPLNIVTKKRIRNNVGFRPAIDNSNYTKINAPRPKAIYKESSKILIKDRKGWGKLIGAASAGGMETRPDNFRPLLRETIVRGRPNATGENMNVVEYLFRKPMVKDGQRIRPHFPSRKRVASASGNLYVEQAAPRGALTMRTNDLVTGGYTMIQGLHHRQNPIHP